MGRIRSLTSVLCQTMDIVFVVRERRWLDEDGIYSELARHHPLAVRTTRLRRSRSAELLS